MLAFGDDGDFSASNQASDKRLTPLAQATRAAMAQSPGSPYSAANYAMPDVPSTNYYAKPRKNTLAEAWGIADPEPFEEFFSGAPAAPVATDNGDNSAPSSIRETNGKSRKSARDLHKDQGWLESD